jgi:hypothetical protein
MSINSLLREILEERANLFLENSRPRFEETIAFASSQYKNASLLSDCVLFAQYNLADGFPAYITILSRIGFFPWVEAEQELDSALYQALTGFYKSSHDSLRRALEIILIGVYYSSNDSLEEQAKKWLKSEIKSPRFSDVTKGVTKLPRFQALDKDIGWKKTVETIYWKLSDVTHVRGMENGFLRI